MTTEQQAREALDALDDYARMANIAAIGPLKVLSDFITQAAEDKRVADAVRGGERFWRAVWGETADGKVTIDREEIVGIPASVLEGE